MKIAVIGTGYVGLVSGVCFAEFGHRVTCVDKNSKIVERLSGGELTIYEPGLEPLLRRNIREGRLDFDTNLVSAVENCDIIMIAVGTPSCPDSGEADLSSVLQAADEVAVSMRPGTVIVVKSTVPVGTCAMLRHRIAALRPDTDFSIASNPEFLREGSAVQDFLRPDRVVVGLQDERGRAAMGCAYELLAGRDVPVIFTSLENAELIKYAANAFLAMKITFINQVADLCEKVGGDVQDVARAIGMDKRIGEKFLQAGPGIGGSCFPKDTRAFAALGRRHGAPQKLIEGVVDINEARKRDMAQRIIDCAAASGGAVVAILGVAYKPNTDDIREAPALDIIPLLQRSGLKVRAHDPAAMTAGAAMLSDVKWCDSALATVEGADVVVILTEWDDYRTLDIRRVAGLMRGNDFFDLRNVFQVNDFSDTGLTYHSVGRPDGVADESSWAINKLKRSQPPLISDSVRVGVIASGSSLM